MDVFFFLLVQREVKGFRFFDIVEYSRIEMLNDFRGNVALMLESMTYQKPVSEHTAPWPEKTHIADTVPVSMPHIMLWVRIECRR